MEFYKNNPGGTEAKVQAFKFCVKLEGVFT